MSTEKIVSLIEKGIATAVKDDQKRVVEQLKEYKADLADDEAIDPKQLKAINATIAEAIKIAQGKVHRD